MLKKSIATALALFLSSNVLYADQLNDVCGNLSTAGAVKTQYCQAAQAASKAADTDGALWKVYAAVASVCTVACASSFMGGEIAGTGIACQGTDLAASATDAVMTKSFTSSLAGIAMSGYGLYTTLSGKPGILDSMVGNAGTAAAQNGTAPAEVSTGLGDNTPVSYGSADASQTTSKLPDAGKKNDLGSCMTAAVAAGQSYAKYSAQKQQQQTVDQNLQNAVNLTTSDAGVSISPSAGTASAGSASSGSTATGTSTGSSVANNETSGASGTNCSSSAASTVQCAVASDSSLAGATTPAFNDALQKAGGMPIGKFISQAQNPTQAMMSGTSAVLTPQGESKLADALSNLSGTSDVGASTSYALGSGRSGGASDDSATDPSAMMAGLFDKLMPKKDGAQKSVTDQEFAQKRRALASANPEENRNLSIFDRIAYRYIALTPRLIGSNQTQATTKTN